MPDAAAVAVVIAGDEAVLPLLPVVGLADGGAAWAVPLHAAAPSATAASAHAARAFFAMIKVSPPRSSLLLMLIETERGRDG
jgi:hypothetical protein